MGVWGEHPICGKQSVYWKFVEERKASKRGTDHFSPLGSPFYEGVVMKRANSPYPIQLRSDSEEFRGWVKHRFLT
jgi:hypothetical protein